ncbi:MAG: DNA repair protein RecO, partial [Roseobacter sp.]
MEWRDEGILLSTRRHGESAAIIEVFTQERGRHAGVVRGGSGRKISQILQPGAQLDVVWRARLEEHIGSFLVEPLRSRAVAAMGDRLSLAGLNAVTALLGYCLPERE